MTKPSRIYYVEQSGAKLSHGERGGGMFSLLSAMLGRKHSIEIRGGTAKAYYADIEWKELEDG